MPVEPTYGDPCRRLGPFPNDVPNPERTDPFIFPTCACASPAPPCTARISTPCFTEHNATVFRDILGLTDAEIEALCAEGVTADEPLVSYGV